MENERAAFARPLTVSQAMGMAKSALESCRVTLIGEVSEVSNKPQYKAVYFTVKDTHAALPCMMWKDRYRDCNIDLRVGMLVQMTGRFTLYAAKGRMNFDVFNLSLAGEGELRARVAAIAQKLQAEGLMAPERKRPLPVFPEAIGLVTSPNGAAVHDVLRTLRRRYPLARILFAGVMVESNQAPANMMQGLRAVVHAGAELVLLVRGGGSFEDLMPFNDEGLARMIAACPVPVVTGIGHEPDTSIADMVADLRASTPTAAAEAIAPDIAQMRARLAHAGAAIGASLQRRAEVADIQLRHRESHPLFTDKHALFAAAYQRLDDNQERVGNALPRSLERDTTLLASFAKRLTGRSAHMLAPAQARLGAAHERLIARGQTMLEPYDASWVLYASRLNDLSPLAVIGRGFSLTRDDQGRIVRHVAEAPVGSNVSIQVSDGKLACAVTGQES